MQLYGKRKEEKRDFLIRIMYNDFVKNRKLLIFLIILFIPSAVFCSVIPDETIYLWKDVPSMKNQKSALYYHGPQNAETRTDIAVIILPGGSYHHLGLKSEGYSSSSWFADNGISAFTLRYRTAQDGYHHPSMLEDVQRAIQLVRENADRYQINPDKVGVIGYSAGGHLCLMTGIFSAESELEKLGIETSVSLRPDFLIPVYPVVSMQDDIAHAWSRKSLLGRKYTPEMQDRFSLELHVPADMPPTYIVVAKDDDVVDYRNSLRMYAALNESCIAGCQLDVYEWGGHGFGMASSAFMRTFRWNEKILPWLESIGILELQE